MYMLRFDMRAPEIGAPTVELYSAATDMCEWAEDHGALAAVLCEHHGSHDGYLPSPLILASAIAARTKRLPITIAALLLPFYDTVRLAEDMAVLDLISKGRVSYILALGYRPEEFEHFGVDIRTRGRLADEKLALLRELLTGEAIFDGRRINTTPAPHTEGGPTLMWGGGSVAAARRAGRYGLGMLGNANVEGMHEAYREACHQHGHEPGPIFLPDRENPSVCFVADDVDKAWDEIGQYLLHDVRAYADWNPGNDYSAGFSDVQTVDELRANPTSHRIYSVAEAVTRVRSGEVLNLSPLCGGVPPELAWPYLKRVGEVVMAEVAR
jgi:alkanesulfonate monooxygenase SsuD/methylene tetrahydromethanopterin reductase-like flavin-dependent oxidoreductase (luciferase family)